MSTNTKQTSKKVASIAAKILHSKDATDTEKKLAASALSQSSSNKQTGAELEDLASAVLHSPESSEDTKILAGSVLSQSNRER